MTQDSSMTDARESYGFADMTTEQQADELIIRAEGGFESIDELRTMCRLAADALRLSTSRDQGRRKGLEEAVVKLKKRASDAARNRDAALDADIAKFWMHTAQEAAACAAAICALIDSPVTDRREQGAGAIIAAAAAFRDAYNAAIPTVHMLEADLPELQVKREEARRKLFALLDGPAMVFYEYQTDDGAILREAAAALSTERAAREKAERERDKARTKRIEAEIRVAEFDAARETAEEERDEARRAAMAHRMVGDITETVSDGWRERVIDLERKVERLKEGLRESRQVHVVACGTTAPYIRIALEHIDALLADQPEGGSDNG